MTSARVLALDLGSSSVRALVFDETLRPVAVARRPVSLVRGSGGAATLDAERYLADLVSCLDELHDDGRLDGVSTAAVCAQWHSLLGVDGHGRPTTEVITWADTRPQRSGPGPEDADAFHQRTGTWCHRLYWSVRLPWLVESGGRSDGYLGLPDYVVERLTGHRATSASIASGTGLLDLTGGAWDEEGLALARVEACRLPEVVGHATTWRLLDEWRRRWPALGDVPWRPPVGDGAASNVGVGAGHEGVSSITIGTSAAVRVVHSLADAPRLPGELWRYRVDDERVVTGRAYSLGGNVHPWVTSLLAGLDDAGPRCAPGTSGLLCVPLHAGSRPPETVPSGSGAVLGLSLDTTADDVLAAALEGVSLEAATAVVELEESFGAETTVVLGGGAVDSSAWWRAATAAVIGRDVLVSEEREVGARGAAAIALGVEPTLPSRTEAADAAAVERFAAVRPRYAEARRLVAGFATGEGAPAEA